MEDNIKAPVEVATTRFVTKMVARTKEIAFFVGFDE